MSLQPNTLINALPTDFDFYHLGRVQKNSEEADTIQAADFFSSVSDSTLVLITLLGDTRGLAVFAFDEGLDSSMYSELANVVASRLADQVARTTGETVMISPPRVLDFEETASLKKRLQTGLPQTTPLHRTRYFHIHANSAVEIQALLAVFPQEETAHA